MHSSFTCISFPTTAHVCTFMPHLRVTLQTKNCAGSLGKSCKRGQSPQKRSKCVSFSSFSFETMLVSMILLGVLPIFPATRGQDCLQNVIVMIKCPSSVRKKERIDCSGTCFRFGNSHSADDVTPPPGRTLYNVYMPRVDQSVACRGAKIKTVVKIHEQISRGGRSPSAPCVTRRGRAARMDVGSLDLAS
ncbi:hypothetical protein BC940DRAFT_302165 [Gongronella butleri]|nr:hypothetical protein BC940DRAFT_302165 [Gongronella butleri]